MSGKKAATMNKSTSVAGHFGSHGGAKVQYHVHRPRCGARVGGAKTLKCYIFKSFYERSFLDNEVIMEEAGKRDRLEYDVDNDDDSDESEEESEEESKEESEEESKSGDGGEMQSVNG